jgi:sarcosine oxidase
VSSRYTFDTIVLGLGAMGSATLYQLAKRRRRVLGIDRFSPPHTYGSTHGDTRIIRQAIGEGDAYTPLSLRSYELWRQIERETGRALLTITGGLIISSQGTGAISHVANFFENTLAAARRYDIRHELLDAAAIRRRFPPFRVRDDEVGYYEQNAGFLRPEECVAAQLQLAEQLGAEVHRNELVEAFDVSNGVIRLRSGTGVYEAGRLVITAGPWLPTLLEQQYGGVFAVLRQVQVWFDIIGDVESFLPRRFPVFIWELPDSPQGLYGFPAVNGASGGIKIATEQYDRATSAESVDRKVSDEEIHTLHQLIAPRFVDVGKTCIKAATCLYTVTADSGFVIDTHPRYPAVIIASPCSGHGFKHSSAIGEAIAQVIADGGSAIDLSPFRLARLVTT